MNLPEAGGKPTKEYSKRGWSNETVHDEEFSDVNVSQWSNTFMFYSLLMAPIRILVLWLIRNHLLASQVLCGKCGNACKLTERDEAPDGYSYRCRKLGHDYERKVRDRSFFQSFKIPLPDVLNFIKMYLDGVSLNKCAKLTNVDYGDTAVRWGKIIRSLFMEWVLQHVMNEEMKFSGEVEVDESLFGRKCKYHRGANQGIKVWVVGLIERGSNRLILYPVENRNKETLTKIIQRHVEPITKIYTDRWGGYNDLNFSWLSTFYCHPQTVLR